MNLEGKTVGILITSSFYKFKGIIKELKKIVSLKANIIPIINNSSYNRIKEDNFIKEIEHITKSKTIYTMQKFKKLKLKDIIDILIILPATSNIISKLANDITDNFEVQIVNQFLKEEKPIVLSISSDNGLSSGAENIGKLLNTKNYYFVPFKQSNPITKPRAITFDYSYLTNTLKYALDKEQIQPILISI